MEWAGRWTAPWPVSCQYPQPHPTLLSSYVGSTTWPVFGSFFFVAPQPKSGLVRHVLRSVEDIRLDTRTNTHTLDSTSLKERSARRRGRYLHNTKRTQEKKIHALSEIRTHDPRNQADSDLSLRPHGTVWSLLTQIMSGLCIFQFLIACYVLCLLHSPWLLPDGTGEGGN
jgi:hypothetical protein